MKGSVEFHHDVENDIVIVTPRWKIETPDDIAVWYEQWVSWLEAHRPNEKVDCVIVLHDFHVDTAVAAAWALNIPPELIGAGLRTFESNPQKTPY